MDIKIPTISTDRLSLRAWVPEDAGELLTILYEKDILHYFPDPSPPSRVKVGRYSEHHLTHWIQFVLLLCSCFPGIRSAPWMDWARIPV